MTKEQTINILKKIAFYNIDWYDEDKQNAVKEAIKSLEAEPQVGHWIYDPNGMDWGLAAWKCSECRNKNDMIPTTINYGKDGIKRVTNPYAWAGSKFCPNCGCKMIPEGEEK